MNDPAVSSGVSWFFLIRRSVLDTESRVPGGIRDPILDMVPGWSSSRTWCGAGITNPRQAAGN